MASEGIGVKDWRIYFCLDPTCPSGLRWDIDIYNSRGALTKARKGRPAGSKNAQGRWQVQVHQEVFLCHTIIYNMLHGAIPEGKMVDHWDGNPANNAHGNIRAVTRSINNRNKRKMSNNSSGVTGVGFWVLGKATHARASWLGVDGRQVSKTFSVKHYGLLPAFAMAVLHRQKMIKKLVEQGAGYTERHGK